MPRDPSVTSVMEASRQFTESLNLVLALSGQSQLPDGLQINESTVSFIRDCSVQAFRAWHMEHLAERSVLPDSKVSPQSFAKDEQANENDWATASTNIREGSPLIQSMDDTPRPSASVLFPSANAQLPNDSTNTQSTGQHDQSSRRRSAPQLPHGNPSAMPEYVPQTGAIIPQNVTWPLSNLPTSSSTPSSTPLGRMSDNFYRPPPHPSQHFYANQYSQNPQYNQNAGPMASHQEGQRGPPSGNLGSFEEAQADISDDFLNAIDDVAVQSLAWQTSPDSMPNISSHWTGMLSSGIMQPQRPPTQEYSLPQSSYSQPSMDAFQNQVPEMQRTFHAVQSNRPQHPKSLN
jgi:hypothetical protein